MPRDRWPQVAQLFAEALERLPEERTAFLAAAEVETPVRVEVESLLRAHEGRGPMDRVTEEMAGLRRGALESLLPPRPALLEGPWRAPSARPGDRLGRYEVRARLGAGGMGEVYRAFDTRLQREVALKLVAPRAGGGPGALAQLEQEARAASALSHPNICTIHDIAEERGAPYIVMELVPGESLRRKLASRLETATVLDWARQIAAALAAAHDRGIVHRDLKPENILVAYDGTVKVVDFGLARFRSAPAAAQPGAAEEPPGARTTLQGTPGYMAPELVCGEQVDFRADQFSFGCIVHEMASGQRAFAGGSALETFHATVHDAPPRLSALRPDVPPDLAAVVERCLSKYPAARYPSTRLLQQALGRSEAPAAAPRRRRRPSAASVIALAAASAAVASFWPRAGAPPAVPSRLVPLTHGEGNDSSPSFAPDGTRLVFASDRGGSWDLWTIAVAGGPPHRLTATPEADVQPAWSPDGSRVAFGRRSGDHSDVFVMPAAGGAARLVARRAMDPAWSPDGRVLAVSELAGGWVRIARVPAAGGEVTPITAIEPGHFHRRPTFTPDGLWLVFNRSPGGNAGQLMRVPAAGGAAVPLTTDPPGTANLQAAATADGHVVHVSDRGGALNLWRIPLAGGAPQRITSGPGDDLEPRPSPDGRRVAFVSSPQVFRLLDVSLETGASRTLASFEGSKVWALDVSPDGSQVAFVHKVAGRPWRPMLMPAGGGEARPLLESLPDVMWVRFLPGGGSLVFEARQGARGRVGVVRTDGTALQWWTAEDEDARFPAVSADGRRLAYVRNEASLPEVVVRAVGGGPVQVTVPDATLPCFAPDGGTLAFAGSRATTGGIGVVDLESGRPRWLSRSGTFPVWLPDGGAVAFMDTGPNGEQVARRVDLAGAVGDLSPFRWHGLYNPFVVAPGGRRLVTSNGSDIKTTLWLAEF